MYFRHVHYYKKHPEWKWQKTNFRYSLNDEELDELCTQHRFESWSRRLVRVEVWRKRVIALRLSQNCQWASGIRQARCARARFGDRVPVAESSVNTVAHPESVLPFLVACTFLLYKIKRHCSSLLLFSVLTLWIWNSSIVQAGLPINDNYRMWLSHHQKLSSYRQKSSWHVRLDTLIRFVKGISVKIVRRCHTEKRVFGPTINLNSKLGWFISILINPTPKYRFCDPAFMCDCLLVE